MVRTRDKLSELRDDAVKAWRTAIDMTHVANSELNQGAESRADLSILGAVQAQASYTLACQLCVQCGHRMINHSIEDGFDEDCVCCVAVGG